MGLSSIWLLKHVVVTGGNLKKATNVLAEKAEKKRFWLWLRKKDKCWGKNNYLQQQPQWEAPISSRG